MSYACMVVVISGVVCVSMTLVAIILLVMISDIMQCTLSVQLFQKSLRFHILVHVHNFCIIILYTDGL